MARKIPSDAQVIQAVMDVLQELGTVGTQEKLHFLAQEELKKIDPAYTVSGERVRKLAISSGTAEIHPHTREGERIKALKKCPVCDARMSPVKSMTLYGGQVTSAFVCNRCKYQTGRTKKVPTRYVFALKRRVKKARVRPDRELSDFGN